MDLRTIAFFAFALGLALADANCTDAQYASLTSCYRTFISAYGFDVTKNGSMLPEYWDFHAERNTWFVNGLERQPEVKKIGQALSNCVKPNEECVDAKFFARLNQNSTDAANYMSDYAVTAYQSTDRGYALLITHKYCITNCKTAKPDQGAKLDDCTKKFKDNTNKKVSDCNDFILCVHDVYTECCGQGAGEYECGTNRADIAISYEACADVNKCIMA